MTLTVTDLLADIEPVVRGWIAEQIGDNANSNIPGDQFEFEFTSLAGGDTLYYDATSFEWKNTSLLQSDPSNSIVTVSNGVLLVDDGNSVAAGLITSDVVRVSAEGSAAGLAIIVAGANPLYRGVFKGTRARGTLGTPTVPSSGDSVVSFLGTIYDGVDTEGTAQIDFIVDGDVSSNTAPQRIAFMTSATTGVARVERMRILSTGDVTIGPAAALGQLHIDQSSASGAQPVLFLDQGDVSEQAIKISYSGADVDMIVIELDVDGAPKISWDESEDRIDFSHGLAIQGASIIDVTSTEALLVRKNADGGDVFVVDTTNSRVGLGIAPESPLHLYQSNVAIAHHGDAVLTIEEGSDNTAISLLTGTTRQASVFFGDSTGVVLGSFQYRMSGHAKPNSMAFLTNATVKMWINEGGDVILGGVGNVVPDSRLHLYKDNANQASHGDAVLTIEKGSDNLVIQVLTGTTEQATIYYGDSTSATLGGIAYTLSGHTTPNSMTFRTANTNRMTINAIGDVGIGVTPTAQLHVDQASTTAAQPVLLLDQGDVSEQLIKGSYSGADVDMTIIELDVDGAPKFGWSETPDVFTLNKGLAVGDGGTTNYANFAGDGELTLFGTARVLNSVDVEPALATRPAANPPDEGTEDSFLTHDFNAAADESVFFHFEIPHDYASAGTIHIHFDFFVDTAPGDAKSVVWGTEYKKQEVGDNFDFGAGTTTGYTEESITTGTPANDKKLHRSGPVALTTTGFEPGHFLLLRFFRDANGTGGTDDYAADARIIDYHIEYLADKLGEAT